MAIEQIDILLDDNLDLRIENGDFVLGDVTRQNQLLLLSTGYGDWRDTPEMGVNVVDFVNGSDGAGLLSGIRRQFEADGMTITTLGFDASGNLGIEAGYESQPVREAREKVTGTKAAGTYKCVHGQNAIDVAIQLTGSVEGLTDVLLANGLTWDWMPVAGAVIVDPGVIKDGKVLDWITKNGIVIATEINV